MAKRRNLLSRGKALAKPRVPGRDPNSSPSKTLAIDLDVSSLTRRRKSHFDTAQQTKVFMVLRNLV